jgi:AraC-like DNA-binding protein/predicted transcriptional regulator YdeE
LEILELDHIDRLNRTIEYIEANLDKNIHLELLARKFALSKYHFHRIFRALIGDPPSRYIEKRKLSSAAADLISSNKRIIDIAFDYGFNSHESFIRSFKKHYSYTPSQFRKNKPNTRFYAKCSIGSIELNLQKGKVKLKPDIFHKSSFTIAGLTYSGHDTNEIFNLWQTFWRMVQKGKIILDNSGCLGACLHDIDMRNREVFVYFAGIAVDHSFGIPKGLKSLTIPESTYAIFKHQGPISEIEQTYDRIYGSWFPLTGNNPTMDMDIILVDHRFKRMSDKSVIDIFIPIQG